MTEQSKSMFYCVHVSSYPDHMSVVMECFCMIIMHKHTIGILALTDIRYQFCTIQSYRVTYSHRRVYFRFLWI